MFLERKTRQMKYKFKTKPYKHQLNALEKSWKKRRDKWAAKGVNLHRPLDIVVALEEEKKKKD